MNGVNIDRSDDKKDNFYSQGGSVWILPNLRSNKPILFPQGLRTQNTSSPCAQVASYMLLLWTHIRSKRVYKFRMGAISILLMTTRTTSTVKEGVSGFYDYPLLSVLALFYVETRALSVCLASI